MSSSARLATEITSELGGTEGWWKTSTEETIYDAAYALLSKGFTPEETIDTISMIISAIREEYGE